MTHTSTEQPEVQTLREAVFTVIEGFTLPHDVRKILETAYYSEESQAREPLSPYQVREIIKKLNANHDEEGWNLGDFVREVEARHGITQEKQG